MGYEYKKNDFLVGRLVTNVPWEHAVYLGDIVQTKAWTETIGDGYITLDRSAEDDQWYLYVRAEGDDQPPIKVPCDMASMAIWLGIFLPPLDPNVAKNHVSRGGQPTENELRRHNVVAHAIALARVTYAIMRGLNYRNMGMGSMTAMMDVDGLPRIGGCAVLAAWGNKTSEGILGEVRDVDVVEVAPTPNPVMQTLDRWKEWVPGDPIPDRPVTPAPVGAVEVVDELAVDLNGNKWVVKKTPNGYQFSSISSIGDTGYFPSQTGNVYISISNSTSTHEG